MPVLARISPNTCQRNLLTLKNLLVVTEIRIRFYIFQVNPNIFSPNSRGEKTTPPSQRRILIRAPKPEISPCLWSLVMRSRAPISTLCEVQSGTKQPKTVQLSWNLDSELSYRFGLPWHNAFEKRLRIGQVMADSSSTGQKSALAEKEPT